MKVFNAVRKEQLHSQSVREIFQLVDMALPFASDMKLLKPSVTHEFNQYVQIKSSVYLTVIVFVVSAVLDLILILVYQLYHLAEWLFPNVARTDNQSEVVISSVHVPEKHIAALSVPE